MMYTPYSQKADQHNKLMRKQINRHNLKIELSDDFNRKVLPDELEKEIETVWQKKMEINPKMWNGSKFRLDRVTEKDDITTFQMGKTSYKDFIGTNWSPNAKKLHKLGQEMHGNKDVFMSHALGVGSFLHTKDDKTVIIKRSKDCAEAVGLWDIPGGHPEPMNIVGKIPVEDIDLKGMSENAVVKEIFDSTLAEIKDEINVPLSTLDDPILLGVARNITSAGRPSSEYYVRCSLTSNEIYELYSSGTQTEAEESVAMKFIPVMDVLTMQDSHADLWKNLAPSAKGCFMLFALAVQNGYLTLS